MSSGLTVILLVCNTISIMGTMIVTNLRVMKEDCNQLRAIAAERGMSANEYINHVLKNVVSKPKKIAIRKRLSIEELPKLAKIATPNGELSEDDKIIYGA